MCIGSLHLPTKGYRTQYQPQFNSHSPRIYQTIFLDRDDSSHLWTDGEIDTDKIILKKWWKQQSHRWQHYGGTVPWVCLGKKGSGLFPDTLPAQMMFINGKYHTYFAGGWTVLSENSSICGSPLIFVRHARNSHCFRIRGSLSTRSKACNFLSKST